MSFEYDELGFAEAASSFVPRPSSDSQDRLARLRLIRSRRVGPATYRRLISEHGSAHAALEALPEVARSAGVERYTACPEGVALAEMKAAKRAGAQMLCLGDSSYPALLAETNDAPPVLWALGDPGLMQRPILAMVGTRTPSSLGTRMARRLARDLSEAGFVIVSGLARGIDALAHAAALDGGTIGVHAGGLDMIYPVENTELAVLMGERGLRLSEMPFGMQPQSRHFPRRNRIVSGLARGVVVVEAAARSGSLITAGNALDQGREVLAVPGHPMDSRAAGCNILIRDGARLVRSAEDVVEAIGAVESQEIGQQAFELPPPETQPEPTPKKTTALPEQILSLLSPSPLAEDQLLRDLGLGPGEVGPVLARLELEGRICRQPGGLLAATV